MRLNPITTQPFNSLRGPSPFSYILHPPMSQYPLSDIDLLQAISIPFDDPKHVYFAEVLFKNPKEKAITTKSL